MAKISLGLICIIAIIPVANATYSIVAADTRSRQVGGAGASCLPGADIFEALYVSVPNHTVMHTQGLLLPRDSPILTTALDAIMATDENADIREILETMQEMDTDIIRVSEVSSFPTVSLRQYGIADFTSHAAYTGQNLTKVYELLFDFETEETDEGGSFITKNGHTILYHALANVVSSGTVDSLKLGFEEGWDEDEDDDDASILAARLMTAMESVVVAGKGDGRCLNVPGDGTSASGAFLHVDNADGTVYVHLNVIGDGTTEPIDELRRRYDAWMDDMKSGADTSGSDTSGSDTSRRLWISFILLSGVLTLLTSL